VYNIDLLRWKQNGYFTAWLNVENRSGISGVKLVLGDSNGSYREYSEIQNMLVDELDVIKIDDVYPNLKFQLNEGVGEWQDFRLVNGENYLFWRADYYMDYGQVNLSDVRWYKVIFSLANTSSPQNIVLSNLRVQDGIQKSRNPANGNWYPPNSAPQYGVMDIDETVAGSKDYKLKLLNVLQLQYPSNGDHVRILSIKPTPFNFSMEIMFTIVELPEQYVGNILNYSSNRKNTWIRLQYDFDNEYDPGHDWFGTFISFEHEKFGVVSTYPA